METNERHTNLDGPPLAGGNGYVPPGHRIVHPRTGTVVVEIVGEHDLATQDTIRDLFVRLVESNTLVVVDLSEATFIDSSFLRALVLGSKHADEVGSCLRVQVGTARLVRQVLEISRLTDYLHCADDRDEALS